MNKGAAEREQVLPPLTDGELATVLEVRVTAKKTRPPSRFTEGTLIEEMKNAGKYVEDRALRAVLKQVNGLGMSSTRDSIIETLKSHKYLKVTGKHIVPTEKGESLVRWLDAHCAELTDIALTARWEAELDAVATRGGGSKFEASIVARIKEIVATLRQAAPIGGGSPENKNMTESSTQAPRANPPTPKMLDFARRIAAKLGQELPEDVAESFDACKAYLDANQAAAKQPTERQLGFARSIAERKGVEIPAEALAEGKLLSAWIDANK
jgi:DNA topoisomerase-3